MTDNPDNINGLIRHDEYAKQRANRNPEFAEAIRNRAIGLLDGSEEDKRIAYRIFLRQLSLTQDEVRDIEKSRMAS